MTESAPPARDDQEPVFRAVLTPHRSLSRLGFFVVMALVCCVSFTAGTFFILKGAWPVLGFLGLDVLLVYLAFRLSYRSGRAMETVELTEDRLTFKQVSPGGRVTAWEFQPYWLRVDIDEPCAHESRVTLSSHGRTVAIGSFLSPEERIEFAQALKQALAGLKGPA